MVARPGLPLADEYLEFVAGRCGPNTVLAVAYAQGLVSSLENWHGYLTGWALPRMFAVADGNPPPMMIVNRQPY